MRTYYDCSIEINDFNPPFAIIFYMSFTINKHHSALGVFSVFSIFFVHSFYFCTLHSQCRSSSAFVLYIHISLYIYIIHNKKSPDMLTLKLYVHKNYSKLPTCRSWKAFQNMSNTQSRCWESLEYFLCTCLFPFFLL